MPADFDGTVGLPKRATAGNGGSNGSGGGKERYRLLLSEALGGKMIQPYQRETLARWGSW